jgi:hypothetical protein
LIPGQKVAYLFGGYGAGLKTHNELVRVDFAKDSPAFAHVPQDNAPPARLLHAFAYDVKLERFILFGGAGVRDREKPAIYNEVWMMKLEGGRAKWTKLELKQPPSPRYGFAYGYDREGGRLIVYSGQPEDPSAKQTQDTWLLSVRAEPPVWKRWERDNESPSGRRNPCFVYDPAEQRLFVFGGAKDERNTTPDLCVFDFGKGREGCRIGGPPDPQPAQRASGFGFHDRARKRILMGFGNDTRGNSFRDLHPLKY